MRSSKELGDYLIKNDLQRPLIVTDPNVSQLGFFKELVGDIKRKNISAEVFHDIHKNPVKSDAESIATGKELWGQHCKSCHGTKGVGDGPKAAQLKTEPGDFSKADFQGQPDGSIFYKTSEGRDDMPSFKKKIPDADERWSIVNYIRTFKK